MEKIEMGSKPAGDRKSRGKNRRIHIGSGCGNENGLDHRSSFGAPQPPG